MTTRDGIAHDAFVDGADLPTREELSSSPSLGASGRELVEALLAHDAERAGAILSGDPALARITPGDRGLLEIAVATGDPDLVEALAAHGVPLDGDGNGGPLVLALHARDPDLAYVLLRAGASPTPEASPLEPFRAAISLNSPAGVRMLIDFGASPDTVGPLGRRPLHIALDMERFTLAEELLAAGADRWAIDASGANLGTSVTTPMVTQDAGEQAAQQRLSARARAAGWPDPAPTPQQVLAEQAEGRWPPRRD